MNKQKEYFTMRMYALNETGAWVTCRDELLMLCAECDSAEKRNIASLPVEYDYVSPDQCRRLSAFLPGIGMVKAGKPLKGATSFLLQAGLALGTGYCFYTGYYVAGVVSGVFPLMKFHKGGNRFSAILAEDRNDREKQKLKTLYNEEIKKVIHP